MRLRSISHRFVESIPDKIEEGVLYVSIPYAIATHKCACGCGNEVVTPLSPVGWEVTFNGENVSLNPSIGNWGFPCKSHYWIERDQVIWARRWNEEEISSLRKRESKQQQNYFNRKKEEQDGWSKVRRWFDRDRD